MNRSFEAKEDELEISSPSRRTFNTKLYGNRRLRGSVPTLKVREDTYSLETSCNVRIRSRSLTSARRKSVPT